ncbi:hypothetical protein M409DRAFT_65797 [Zasmidium cellare ATCC 36951]|uniref:Calcineurin-like phosphoesterase domain-containing protein n=1 Tax=Zasmidium cellare ATCC 36951 TaxID=1080233 RepID=A0A6A6CPH3_ZASCE|nr:uncharacterized protein M409DRAFT_65797 [Zasmidium cellare ATCC 36951]KAF2167659.1 hypothetical protein M409DRAFT_65797 [Zasmidium cellare ATCC 36951]
MASPYDIPPLHLQLQHPLKLLARLLHYLLSLLYPDRHARRNITVVCISDTHCLIPKAPLPYGDILIHAGDLTNAGTPSELQAQIDWLAGLPHQHKVVVAGNHDTWLDPESRKTLSDAKEREGKVDWKGIHYLQNTSVTLDFPNRTSLNAGKITLFGAPHTPDKLGPQHAFQYPRGTDVWSDAIPDDTDILVTHSPPAYHLDLPSVRAMGDEFLLQEVRRVKPLLHVFGHIHAGKSDFLGLLRGGQEVVRWDASERYLEETLRYGAPGGVLDGPVRVYYLGMMVVSGVLEMVREVVFDWEVKSTRMVNAAMVFCNTGRIGNGAQVVHI